LSFSEGGKKQLRIVPPGRVAEVRTMSVRYRKLRESRARLVKLHKEMLAMMDEMEAMRREEVD